MPMPNSNVPKRAAVINVVTDDKLPKETHTIVQPNHAAYAAWCGAEYRTIYTPSAKIYQKSGAAVCTWKFELTKVAAEYDVSLYLDNDCVITNRCPNFINAVPENHWGLVDELPFLRDNTRASLASCWHGFLDNPYWSSNGGVMIMPRDAARAYHPVFGMPTDWLADQVVLTKNLLAGVSDYRLLDMRWNWMLVRYRDFHEHMAKAYILHAAGSSYFEPIRHTLDYLRLWIQSYGFNK